MQPSNPGHFQRFPSFYLFFRVFVFKRNSSFIAQNTHHKGVRWWLVSLQIGPHKQALLVNLHRFIVSHTASDRQLTSEIAIYSFTPSGSSVMGGQLYHKLCCFIQMFTYLSYISHRLPLITQPISIYQATHSRVIAHLLWVSIACGLAAQFTYTAIYAASYT